jgi:hypothetical protein
VRGRATRRDGHKHQIQVESLNELLVPLLQQTGVGLELGAGKAMLGRVAAKMSGATVVAVDVLQTKVSGAACEDEDGALEVVEAGSVVQVQVSECCFCLGHCMMEDVVFHLNMT